MTPARNRVTPMGEIEAFPLRGAWTGNRGILHAGHEIVRFHASDLWITCALEFRGRRHEQWQPHHYTFLYFHDEAVSFAAGHRPCAECRRESYNSYRAAWADGLSVATAVGEADQPAAARRADRPWQPPPAHSPAALARPPRRYVRSPRRRTRPRPRRPTPRVDACRIPAADGRDRPTEPPTSSHRPRPSPSCAPATGFRSTTPPASDVSVLGRWPHARRQGRLAAGRSQTARP